MSLKPEKMSRIRVIASSSRKPEIVTTLHDLGVLQLEPVSKDLGKFLSPGKPESSYREINSLLQRFRGYENSLPPGQFPDKIILSKDQLISEAEKLNLDEEISSLKRVEEDQLSEKKEIENRLSILANLGTFNQDLGILNNSVLISYILKGDDIQGQIQNIQNSVRPVKVYSIGTESVLVIIRKGQDSEIARYANDLGLLLINVPDMHGKPEDYRRLLEQKLKENQQAIDSTRKGLSDLSSRYWGKIVQVREGLEIENRKLEAAEKFLTTDDTFTMEGWIPSAKFRKTEMLLSKVAEGKIIVREISTEEDPPTLFSNPKKFRFFEFFVRFYSLPQEYEIDPTVIFGIIFPLFFGIMVGDWGYGLVILGLSIWMSKKLNTPNAKTILPKSLTSFALTIFGKGPLRVLAKTLMVGSIVAIGAGLLFNSFFGFPLLPVTVFELVRNVTNAHIGAFPPSPLVIVPATVMVPKLLLLTGYIGLAMVTFGLVLGFINEYYRKHRAGMVSRIGWILVSWGFAILGLALIHHDLSLNFSVSLQTPVSLAMIIAGVGTVIATEKATGAIEVLSIISHILSYTRILGILLASVILSEVIDIIFMKGVDKSPLLAVVGIIILVFGQLFNLVIAIFEPGIQGARLLYVEFFSKFYRGNGHYFRPFGTQRRYTAPKYSLEEELSSKN